MADFLSFLRFTVHKEVVGVEFFQERVDCSEFLAELVRPHVSCDLSFKCADVYGLSDRFSEPFDVVLCLGDLYHVADPAYILRQIGALTGERMILQTTQVLYSEKNYAQFKVRREDKTKEG